MLESEEFVRAPEAGVKDEAPLTGSEPEKDEGLLARILQAFSRLRNKEDDEENVTAEAPPRRPPQRHTSRRPPQGRGPAGRTTPATVDDIPLLFKVNSEVLVQVTKGPVGTKGARVTTNLSIPGRYLVLLPNTSHIGVSKRITDHEERQRLRQILRKLRARLPRGMGVICRTAAAGIKEKYFEQDLEILLSYWEKAEQIMQTTPAPCCVYQEPRLVERALRDVLTEDIDEIVTDNREVYKLAQEMVGRFSRGSRIRIRHHTSPTPLFKKYHLTEQIENIYRRRVNLPGGGYIAIDETEALVAIDVNTGKNRAGKDHPETILNTNLEAAEEVARQLRLRNIGGLIVVDFIDMRSRRDRQQVYREFLDHLHHDRSKTRVLPISRLGLLEMSRQREHGSIRDVVFAPCPYCNGRGVIKSATSVSVEIQRRIHEILRRRRGPTRIRVTVHPTILERLRDEDGPDPALHIEEFVITDADTGAEL